MPGVQQGSGINTGIGAGHKAPAERSLEEDEVDRVSAVSRYSELRFRQLEEDFEADFVIYR